MHDIVITGGLIVDGTGSAPIRTDVAVDGERIAALGDLRGAEAARTIDATGCFVTPGFVDIHTHLDAQICWDPLTTSTCWHGVTSLVLGSCGVTFAPCKTEDQAYLAKVMEAVEDIPADTIVEGLGWDWETYGDYLSMLDRLPKALNVGGMVGHSAVRYYVMGERSLTDEPATPKEIAEMMSLVAEAMSAGALGFSTSRSVGHRVPDGRNTPGTWAPTEEMVAFGDVLAEFPHGVYELAPRLGELDAPALDLSREELAWMAEAARRSGGPMTFALAQNRPFPDFHAAVLGLVDEIAAETGADLRPQTTARSIGYLFGLQARTPFDHLPQWAPLRAFDMTGRLAYLRDKREELVRAAHGVRLMANPKQIFPLGLATANYDYDNVASVAADAEAKSMSVAEMFIDDALTSDGLALWNWPILNQTMAAVEQMLDHPAVVLGLGDSGAHVGAIMDASWPTFLLTYWVRERKKFAIEEAVRRMTSEPAELFALQDRGVVRIGAFADINIFDFDALSLPPPVYVNDFPLGAGRFVQRATGYRYTLVNGVVLMEDGEHTGAMPGSVLRA